MTRRGRRWGRFTARLRAIAGRSERDASDVRRSRVHVGSFEHTHRVWIPPDPPRRWFENQGIERWK